MAVFGYPPVLKSHDKRVFGSLSGLYGSEGMSGEVGVGYAAVSNADAVVMDVVVAGPGPGVVVALPAFYAVFEQPCPYAELRC